MKTLIVFFFLDLYTTIFSLVLLGNGNNSLWLGVSVLFCGFGSIFCTIGIYEEWKREAYTNKKNK